MGQNTRRFALRVLLIHLLLFAAVIGMVVIATREIYQTTRAQVIASAGSPQALLAAQTADGIASFYASIRDDMDLLRHADNEDSAATQPSTSAATTSPANTASTASIASTRPAGPSTSAPALPAAAPPAPPTALSPATHPTSPPRAPLLAPPTDSPFINVFSSNAPNLQQRAMAQLGAVLWRQLQGRVTHLFSVEELRLAELERKFERSRLIDPKDSAIHSIDNPTRPLTAAEVQLIYKKARWIRSLDKPGVSTFVPAAQDEEHEAVNLVVVPLTPRNRGRRALVADVPLRVIDEKFLRKLREERGASTVLLDEESTIMTASDPAWIGLKLKDAPPPAVPAPPCRSPRPSARRPWNGSARASGTPARSISAPTAGRCPRPASSPSSR